MTIQLNGKTPTKICMFQSRLPAEYQEVEYIESSGTQYIDSGIPGANGYIAEAKIVFNDVGGTTDDAYFLGSAGSYPNNAAYITKQGQGVRRWRQSIANDQYIVGGSVTTNTEYIVKSTILTSGNSLVVNGSTIGTRTYASSYNNGYNLWIFAMNSLGAIGSPFKGKCYYLKIWQGSESNLVRDFVPCYRKADSVIGLYDLVNDTFYTNSGSGTFTKGANIWVEQEIKKIVIFPDGVTEKQIRPVIPPIPDYLCFTANTASSTIQLNKAGSPNSVTLETSTDGSTWSTYTFGNAITLSNIGDKVYWRNTSETTTGFSKSASNYYRFGATGSLQVSGDITSLINKDFTDTLNGNYTFYRLFATNSNSSHDWFTSCPKLPATTLTQYCYQEMFRYCSGLETLPELPALTLTNYCYSGMFRNCSKIKLSSSKTGNYQTKYRIPITGTGTTATYSLQNMFSSTGGTFSAAPSINTTYYTSNILV